MINELDYDQAPGTPPTSDSKEFVEIYNSSADAIALDGLSLVFVNGGSATPATYNTVALTGSLAAGAYLLVHDSGYTPPGTCGVAIAFTCATDCIQNAGTDTTKPDSVMLVRVATNEVIDAVSYEGCIPAVAFGGGSLASCEGGGVGAPADPNIDGSISRIPNAGDTNNNAADFKFTATATPCAANVP